MEVLQKGLYSSSALLNYTCQLLESVVAFCKHSMQQLLMDEMSDLDGSSGIGILT